MKKFILLIFLISAIVLVGAEMGQGSGSSDLKIGLLPDLSRLFETAQTFFALVADVTIRIVNDLYAASPEPLRCVFGLVFQAGALLALLGLWTLLTGVRLWEKHF